MKTIHVNITSKKKNVYFYDFWVITLLFANKILNDNQPALWTDLFLSMKRTRSAQVLNTCLIRYRHCTTSLPADVGMWRLDGEWRGQSLVMLTDRQCMNICVIKKKKKRKKVLAPDGWLQRNLTAAKKHHAADPLVRSWRPRRLEKNKDWVKKKKEEGGSTEDRDGKLVGGGGVTVGSILVSLWQKQMILFLSASKLQLLWGIEWKMTQKLKTSTFVLLCKEGNPERNLWRLLDEALLPTNFKVVGDKRPFCDFDVEPFEQRVSWFLFFTPLFGFFVFFFWVTAGFESKSVDFTEKCHQCLQRWVVWPTHDF